MSNVHDINYLFMQTSIPILSKYISNDSIYIQSRNIQLWALLDAGVVFYLNERVQMSTGPNFYEQRHMLHDICIPSLAQ